MDIPSHGLRRELRLWDLVPMQIALIVWLGWAGFAAKQGATQIVLWLLAVVLFYLPLAAVVIKLSRALPLEGGVYQWVKAGISPFAGYMAAWNLTIYSISAFAIVGSLLADGFAHVAGPRGAWMSTSKPFAIGLTALVCIAAFLFNRHGLDLTKWWSNTGSLLTIATFVAMLWLLAKAWITSAPLAHTSFSLAWPAFSLLSVNVFIKMSIGALAGFDSSGIFSEECRRPGNDVARSVMIAAPLIALMYILGTSSVLAYITPANVDLSAAVPQLVQVGFGSQGFGAALAAAVAVGFNVSFTASAIIYVGMIARLPMVAGWDGLLPRWWSALHPKFRTPSKAIFAVAACIFFFGILSLVGAGNQEAVQVAVAAGIASLCIMYALLFSVILFGFRGRRPPLQPSASANAASPGASQIDFRKRGAQQHGTSPEVSELDSLRTGGQQQGTVGGVSQIDFRVGWGIRLAALSAFLCALVGFGFQIVPIGDVSSPIIFALKVAGVILAANALGAFLYFRAPHHTPDALAAPDTLPG